MIDPTHAASTLTTSTPTIPRRSFVPQFSLRLLFVLVTLSAIGTALWYRWPIVEEVDLYAQLPDYEKRWVTPAKARATRGEYSYRREWGGGRIRHGWSREYNFQGKLVREELWSEGQRHGPSRSWNRDGKLEWEAAFAGGRPHGKWSFSIPDQKEMRTIEFGDGVAIRAGGKPWPDPLNAKLRAGEIHNTQLSDALTQPVTLNFVTTPLTDQIVFLQLELGIPIQLDSKRLEAAGIKRYTSITCYPDPDAAFSLATTLAIILEPMGLVADYRFGLVTIIPADGAGDWHDRTGVSEIRPPRETSLATAWDWPVTLDFVEQPIDQVTAELTAQTNVRFNISAIPNADRIRVTKNLRGRSFQNSLGILLDDLELHVHRDGYSLVITPARP
jgi:hypothetical protein